MKGQELWRRAKKIIPGGNQLLSKRPERFLPEQWPTYYQKAKGCEVWDLDDNHYYDFTGMGVCSCILGYADNDVNTAVIEAINNGSMSTLNCYEEIELAEKLISLHSWADMVRFAKTGGEACAMAIRIARAATGKSKVAFCGYHGWHDWYLAANIGESTNLDGQLLPGLGPLGVPRELINSIHPFRYNNIEDLEILAQKYGKEIGVIIMEPMRKSFPDDGFLNKVRGIADELGAVLIIDEVTAGFRMKQGGIHLYFGVEPDIAIFGKALGNGFPISAVVGRQEIMDYAQDTFISSTLWTERVGFVAALATLRKMQENDVQNKIIALGERLISGWEQIALKNGLEVKVSGVPSLCQLSFVHDAPLELQTLYAQEMLVRGYLAGTAVALSFAHTEEIIDQFISVSDTVFGIIREAVDSGDVQQYLKGGVIDVGFKRLT